MIYDDLKNIEKYNIVSKEVLNFIKSLSADIVPGHYLIDENSYVNVDEYETKNFENCLFEAHKNYIDIQIMIDGAERLDYTDTEDLTVSKAYDESRDVMFFKEPGNPFNSVCLTSGKFVLLYPYEAHKPQINCNGIVKKVKKAVVKIKYE